MAEILTTGDARLDELITNYSNATFDCGEWRELLEYLRTNYKRTSPHHE